MNIMDMIKTDDDTNRTIGKYYNSAIDYDATLNQMKEDEELLDLKSKWLNELDYYYNQIDVLEKRFEQASDEKTKLEVQTLLQPFYEKKHVAEQFLPRFITANNLSLLKAVYNNGLFLSILDAEKKREYYDNILYFQTSDYKRKRNLCTFLKIVTVILSLPLFIEILGRIVLSITGIFTDNGTMSSFGAGLFAFCGGIAFTLPAWAVFGMWLLPALVDKLIMGDKVSPEDRKQRNISRTAAVTSGIITGAIMGNENKKVNEKYKVKE